MLEFGPGRLPTEQLCALSRGTLMASAGRLTSIMRNCGSMRSWKWGRSCPLAWCFEAKAGEAARAPCTALSRAGSLAGVARSADADELREMIGFAFQQPMKLSIIGMTGEANSEKSPESLAQRNPLPRT